MSGKQKQAHRTKGNVRPSSSARSAEHLASSGATVPGFIGFGALSDLGYVPASGASEEADASVDPDFRMVLRKMSKRDSTTKIKALQELSTLCKEKDLDSVKTVLPFWPRIFGKLSTDNDRRVREACHQTFEQMVLRVRKNLAPHLKSLMGPWIVGQCDVYPPAASAAKASFQAAFPPTKQPEAVAFCKEEVIGHISDNLLVLSPTTLSDPKTTDKEDMDARYQKLVASSLQGWKLLMSLLDADHQVKLRQQYTDILNNTKFWKLGKHQTTMIRGSFYLLMGALCQSNQALANDYADKICLLVLHNLDESDPAVCPALWEAALYTISTIEDCWSKVNPRKGVFPKLWTMMRHGGNGCAYLIYPNLLPFLGKIPADIIGDGVDFYKEWFGNTITGLSDEKVKTSKMEVSAIIHSLIECMKYVLSRCDSDGNTDCPIEDELLQEQLLRLLEASFVDEAKYLSTSPLYSLAADLLLFLHGHESVALQESSSKLWKALNDCIQDHVAQSEGDNDYTLARIGSFLEALVNPMVVTDKTKTKITFAEKGKSEPTIEKTVESIGSNPLLDVSSPLVLIINEACSTSLRKAQQKEAPSIDHMKLLSVLCNSFPSAVLVRHLYCTHFEKSEKEMMETNWSKAFLQDLLLPWIGTIKEYQLNKKIFVQGIVDLLFLVYKLGSAVQKTNMLALLCKNDNIEVLVLMCEKIVEQEKDPIVHKWLRGAQFGEAIVSNTKELCVLCLGKGGTQDAILQHRWHLLELSLTTQLDTEPMVGKEYISMILSTIHGALPQQDERVQMLQAERDNCITFVSDVAILLFREMKESFMETSAEDLLLSLYQLSCQQVAPVSDIVLAKVREAWKLGVTSLIQLKGGLMNDDGFLVRAASHIKQLVKNGTQQTCARLEQLSKLTLELAHHIGLVLHEEGSTVLSHPTVMHFMQLFHLDPLEDSLPKWEAFCMVTGQLTFADLPARDHTGRNLDVPQCIAPTVFTSDLLLATVRDDVLLTENNLAAIINVAYAIAVCRSLIGKRKQLLCETELVKVCEKLESNLLALIQKIPTEYQTAFVESVMEKSFSEGRLWSLCLQVVLIEVSRAKWNLASESLFNMTDRLNGLVEPVLHTLQVTTPYLGKGELGAVVEILAAQLLSCDQETITDITGGRGFLAGACVTAAQQEILIGDSETRGGVHLDPQVILSVLTEVQLWREQHEDLFLFESDLGTAKWELVSLNIEVMRLLKLLVEKLPAGLSEHQWDFLLCSLVSWIQTCHESRKHLNRNPIHQSFLYHTCELLSSIATCIKHVLPERKEAFPQNLATEWKEFFSQGAYSLLLPLYVQCTDSLASKGLLSANDHAITRVLCTAVCECPLEHLKSHQLPAKLVADHDTNAPDDLQTVLNHLCPRLISENRATQITAYRLLENLVPELPAYDVEKENSSETDKESQSPPPALMSVLDTCRAAVDLIMSDIPVGEPIIVDADTEEDLYSRGYLLCWDLLLTFFKAAPSEMRAQYASFLRNLDAVDHLLANLFRLMPENPVIRLKDTLTSHSPNQKLSSVMSMFSREPMLPIAGDNSSLELQHLACTVYHRALQDLPAIVRQWWNAQDKRVAGIVDKFTSKYATQVLCSEEMEAVHKSEVAMEDMTVKTRPAAREVAATYTIQEFTMELVITLPVNHPLGVVSVESGKRVGVPTNLWRNWMLQMTTFLTHQNGTILDGLALWKRNVDKKFAGVEECMVCFSVIHPSNYQLPKLQCKVCKKKFHSACLYKWFSTSNNSTCPMCRSLF